MIAITVVFTAQQLNVVAKECTDTAYLFEILIELRCKHVVGAYSVFNKLFPGKL